MELPWISNSDLDSIFFSVFSVFSETESFFLKLALSKTKIRLVGAVGGCYSFTVELICFFFIPLFLNSLIMALLKAFYWDRSSSWLTLAAYRTSSQMLARTPELPYKGLYCQQYPIAQETDLFPARSWTPSQYNPKSEGVFGSG